jgi:hypothetical protein
VRYLILLAGLALCTGCKRDANEILEQVVEESHPLESNGSLRVKNVDGTIRFYAWANPVVQIRATTKAFAVERLRAIRPQISSTANSLSIETIFPSDKKWSLRDRSGIVDYVILMPDRLTKIEAELNNGEISIDGLRAGSVRAMVENGRLSAKNCFANLDYEAKSGAIDFYYNWWEAGTYLCKATIFNGAIGVFLPHDDSSFHLEAETKGGTIISNLLDEDERVPSHRKKITRTFGSGDGPTFRFNALTGNIRIHGY